MTLLAYDKVQSVIHAISICKQVRPGKLDLVSSVDQLDLPVYSRPIENGSALQLSRKEIKEAGMAITDLKGNIEVY